MKTRHLFGYLFPFNIVECANPYKGVLILLPFYSLHYVLNDRITRKEA